MWEVVPGKTAWGVGQGEEGAKEATAGCVVNRLPLWAAEAPPPGTSGDGVEHAPSFLSERWGISATVGVYAAADGAPTAPAALGVCAIFA